MAGLRARRARRQRAFRWTVLVVLGVFFLLPLFAMLEFTTRGGGGTWRLLVDWPRLSQTYPDLSAGIVASLGQAALTSLLMLVLLVPTAIWVRIRLPWLRRFVEFICLLPLTIPAIVLAVGLFPVYNRLEHYSISALLLFWAYVVLALPYAYRALAAGLNAMDVTTLSEAARGLGASWFTVIVRVIAPNMWQAILNALLLTSALVLGEFTIAYLLGFVNLQVELYSISRNTANATVIFSTSVASLLFAFVLLLILSYAGRRRRGRR